MQIVHKLSSTYCKIQKIKNKDELQIIANTRKIKHIKLKMQKIKSRKYKI